MRIALLTLSFLIVVAWTPAGHHHGHRHHHNVCEPIIHTPLGDFCSIGPTPF